MARVLCRFVRRCLRFCQRSQTLNQTTTTLLQVSKHSSASIEEVGSSAVGIRKIWFSVKTVFDTVWLQCGKPTKHCWDFCRYIRGEAGYITAHYICVCCKKSKSQLVATAISTTDTIARRTSLGDLYSNRTAGSTAGNTGSTSSNRNSSHPSPRAKNLHLRIKQIKPLKPLQLTNALDPPIKQALTANHNHTIQNTSKLKQERSITD